MLQYIYMISNIENSNIEIKDKHSLQGAFLF